MFVLFRNVWTLRDTTQWFWNLPEAVIQTDRAKSPSHRPSRDSASHRYLWHYTIMRVPVVFLFMVRSALFAVLSGVWSGSGSEEGVWRFRSQSCPRRPEWRKLSGVHIWSHQCWKNLHFLGSEEPIIMLITIISKYLKSFHFLMNHLINSVVTLSVEQETQMWRAWTDIHVHHILGPSVSIIAQSIDYDLR